MRESEWFYSGSFGGLKGGGLFSSSCNCIVVVRWGSDQMVDDSS